MAVHYLSPCCRYAATFVEPDRQERQAFNLKVSDYALTQLPKQPREFFMRVGVEDTVSTGLKVRKR